MIKRVSVLFTLLIWVCSVASADDIPPVKLSKENPVHSENLAFAYITFEYLYNVGDKARVRVSLENITQFPPHALLLFRDTKSEKELKRGEPKIEFEKGYPGEKGMRSVTGFEFVKKPHIIIIPAETDTLFTVDISLNGANGAISLPLYEADYKPKDLLKKGKDKIKYKIVEERLSNISIEVDGWSEEDPTYVSVSNGVDRFISSLKTADFCTNKKHLPSLEVQERPYKATRDSLINAIDDIVRENGWMSDQLPHKAYFNLKSKLRNVDFKDYESDCGNHKPSRRDQDPDPVPPPQKPKCRNCSLSASELYNRLDNLYQQLHGRRISKSAACKAANALYNCYRHKNRKDAGSYREKITRFYNRIVNY